MIKKDIYQHFGYEERELIDKTYDLIRQVEDTYSFYVTGFLNPRQIKVMTSILGQTDLQVYLSSDYIPSEYARLLVAPAYYDFELTDFGICLLEIHYNSKFNQLTHGQIMGTLINRLGIDRQLLGDILVQKNRAQVFLESSMVSYLENQVSKIGRAAVTFEVLDFDQQLRGQSDAQELTVLASSLRLDKMISAVFNISRAKANKLIESEKVKLNYLQTSKASQLLELGDLISIRGYGRFILKSTNGLSKNGKQKLTIERIARK